MSVRLFHEHTRIVVTVPAGGDARVWWAIHRRPVDWAGVFSPALLLVGFQPDRAAGGLRFGSGAIQWTSGPLWTTIRLTLPPCSERKAALLTSGLLKAARYARVPEPSASA